MYLVKGTLSAKEREQIIIGEPLGDASTPKLEQIFIAALQR